MRRSLQLKERGRYNVLPGQGYRTPQGQGYRTPQGTVTDVDDDDYDDDDEMVE